MIMKNELTPKLKELLRTAGSYDRDIALAATHEFAKALELPLRKGVMDGENLNGIFEAIKLDQSATPEFPLDFLSPGSERDFVAYTIPNHGYIPERHVEGDY